jgi:ATP-dependent DNA helicase RecG
MAKILRIWQNDGKNDGKNLFNKDLSENEKRVLLELINNPSILYDPLVVKLKISKRTVSRVFESLVKKRYIQRVGSNKKGYWKVIK